MRTLLDEGMVDVTKTVMESHGVYLLLWKGEVVYVGKSKHVFSRLAEHRRNMDKGNAMKFDQVFIKHCAANRTWSTEYIYIRKFQPKYNIHMKIKEEFPYVTVDLKALGIIDRVGRMRRI